MLVANGRYMNQIGPGRDWYVSLIRFWAFLSLGGSGLITKEEMRSSSFKSLCYISPLSFLSPPSPPPSLLGFRKRKKEKKGLDGNSRRKWREEEKMRTFPVFEVDRLFFILPELWALSIKYLPWIRVGKEDVTKKFAVISVTGRTEIVEQVLVLSWPCLIFFY